MHKITTVEDGKVYDIELTRGDSLLLTVAMQKNKQAYTPVEGETVRFAMKYKYKDPDTTALVVDIPIDTLILEIKPEDTKPFAMEKTYFYDIELTDINGRVDTFIEGKFTLTGEVL